MSDPLRKLAPFSAETWEAIDDEASSVLKLTLAGRKLVDFAGPLGFQASAIGLGRTQPLDKAPNEGVTAALRKVQPLVELRAPFKLSRSELRALECGAKDADLGPITAAARAMALAEDRLIFNGYPEAQIEGIRQAAADAKLPITEDYEAYPAAVAKAVAKLRSVGVEGPYAIALGPRCYTGLTQTTTRGGFPVIEHVKRLLDGPVVWAPAVDGAMVMSQRGGDFELTVGRDLSIGYLGHSATEVELYLEETVTFRVLAAEAAVPLTY